jgi:phosphohistidine swiveling domain-containing protein
LAKGGKSGKIKQNNYTEYMGIYTQKWFQIENIPRANYMMLVPIFSDYGALVAGRGGSKYFMHVLWLLNKDMTTLCYLRDDFDKGIKFLANKAVNNPGWVDQRNQEIVKYTKKYFSFAKSLENKNYFKLSDRELVKTFKELIEYQKASHHSGQITTWLIDADQQLFTKRLLSLLENKIKISGQKINLAEAFSTLTTPEEPSFMEIESRDSLEMVTLLGKDRVAVNLFLKNDVGEIENKLNQLKPVLQKKIKNHYKKYLWLHYNYEGPILQLDYFLEIWKGLLRQGKADKFLKESREKFPEIKRKRTLLFKQLNFLDKEKKVFDVAKDIVWLKGWRKDCMYFGAYVLDKIMKEIGRRLGLTLRQVRYFCYWEVSDALQKNKYDVNKLNERYEYSIVYTNSKSRPVIYSGKEAKKNLEKLHFEKQKIKKVDELVGICASPGKARGRVVIIETVDDLGKMKKGSIMLSETTYPALVPAMKLASAIVTNIGGLTCHAAIVSRELKIPCVVGTKIATKVLKDGDLVEVDATKGVVKILKK